ncbi:alanine dehydrogenase [Elusimicrobium simillimum]|uniref:alanine dehydrogenase n=1 Tax=Elusimicrobium simillimum TaxID=3143438 RepID=UPI003C6FB1DF
MKIGCPKEIKNNEYRVGLTPNAAEMYVKAGHQVYIETGAGKGSAIEDTDYEKAGCKILPAAAEVWNTADMIVKVKEPLEQEYPLMREGQILFTYFHFAASEPLLKACLKQKIISIAYETVEENGALPLLKPMSEVAGRMAMVMGAFYLGKPYGGRGVLATGLTGVAPASVTILGGGVVGTNAAKMAAGMGANVSLLDLNLARLERLSEILPPNVDGLFSDNVTLENALRNADIVVGAVLIPGAKAPKLVRKEHLKIMKPGSVMVDVAIDQGGCFETSRPTTHSDPIYEVDGIIHYCVANMPGAYARSSTFALNNATLKYGLELANKGAEKACRENPALKSGLNTYKGVITLKAVAEAFGMLDNYTPPEKFLS